MYTRYADRASATISIRCLAESAPEIEVGKHSTMTMPGPYGHGTFEVSGMVEKVQVYSPGEGVVEMSIVIGDATYTSSDTATFCASTTYTIDSWSVDSTADWDRLMNYEWYYGSQKEREEGIEMAMNLVRKVLVVRSDGSEYQFKEYGPYVSDDPDKLVRNVLIKYGSADPIFAGIEPESDALTFVVYALDCSTEIPYLDVD